MTRKALGQFAATRKATSNERVALKSASNFTMAYAISGGGARYTFSISPAVNGRTTWDLSADGALSITASGTYVLVPQGNYSINVVMWGGAGGSVSYSPTCPGGAGGSSTGFISFVAGESYDFIVGSGGGGGAANRNAGGGGGGTGIQFTTNTTPILVAGGGGGGYGDAPGAAGAGGGSSGQAGGFTDCPGGAGGTQSAAGVGAYGGRRTGASGSGRNGGGGATGSVQFAGGTGFGNGGVGTYNGGDAGSGGGGGGYWGGAEGSGNVGGSGGGGGSGYFNPAVVTNGSTTAGNFGTAANASDPKRPIVTLATSAYAGSSVNGGANGSNGAIVMSIL